MRLLLSLGVLEGQTVERVGRALLLRKMAQPLLRIAPPHLTAHPTFAVNNLLLPMRLSCFVGAFSTRLEI